jgi:hypothetical protein
MGRSGCRSQLFSQAWQSTCSASTPSSEKIEKEPQYQVVPMKKIQIFGLVIIAVAIGIIVSTAGDASTYVDFTKAKKWLQDGDNESIHVVGKLKKDVAGQILEMEYRPEIDPNLFVFTLVDNNNVEQKVVYKNTKPRISINPSK